MKKETVILIVVALVVGLLVGILFSKGKKEQVQVPAAGAPAPPVADFQQKIKLLEQMVAREPGNRNAWVELGHSYFDLNQPAKAVEAYDKALAIDPNDPNVLTDQGVMFRQLGWYDRAVDNFLKANQIDPSHYQSLYNLGIVYRFDLKDPVKAREYWTKYLAIHPTGPGADQVRAELQALGALPGTPQGQ